MGIIKLRREYHHRICDEIIRIRLNKKRGVEYPNFADGTNRSSTEIARGVVNRLGCPSNYEQLKGQSAGGRFEVITRDFMENEFEMLRHLRPGNWHYSTVQTAISGFDQYEHLAYIYKVISQDKALSSALGGDYIVKPDIVIGRWPISDEEINRLGKVVAKTENFAAFTSLREVNRETRRQILHASISCNWTIRSDRSQNARTEALNLVRNRKGHLPRIVAVTAEPLPKRIATLALCTGDLDCVYHFALYELREAILEMDNEDQYDMLSMLIEGRRLRDISDLPFDLAT